MLDTIVGWSTLLITGALVGWLAGVIFGANARISLSLHAVGGFVGALLGGALFLMWVAPQASVFDISSLLYGLAGAAILSGLLRLLTRHHFQLDS